MDKASDDTNRREIGLQFTFHIYEGYSLPDLLRIIRLSVDRYGFDQVWINDNLGFHQVYVALAALASSRLPASLGTSVTNPYARNPIDVAATFASLAQVMGPVTAVMAERWAWESHAEPAMFWDNSSRPRSRSA